MSKNRLMLAFSVLMIAAMLFTACAPKPTEAPTQAPAPTKPAEQPTAVAPTEEPTPEPSTRVGGWLDEIVMSVVSGDSAVTQLKAGAIDIYANGRSSADLPAIKEAGLSYSSSNGLYYDMIYNPGVCSDPKMLNPFSNRKIREATNWLYDRNYINQEVYAGGGLVKFFAIQTNGPDYAELADVARALEAKYAYNFDKAKEVIKTEMEGMGATLGADGKWEYEGAPVTIILLTRPDSDGTRKPIGDYVAAQFEAVGFKVDHQYKNAAEASPLWIQSEPTDCLWHSYTAAWSSTAISRDEKNMFQQMYLNTSVQGMPVFLANVSDPEFQKVGDDLNNGKFTTLAERHDMFAKAMELSLQDSLQVFLIDGKNYTPYNTNVQVTSDLAAGVESAQLYPFTLRFKGQEGGQLKWATQNMFADPWNQIGGSNWTFDQGAQRATASAGFMADPYTGLAWPLRAEKAEITVLDSLPPTNKTLDWVTLSTAPEIQVPADAWADWDAKTQTFIPAGEGVTSQMKSVVYYPADLYSTVKWHDGSNFSAADVVMALILTFDRAKPDSAIYDEAAVPVFESFMSYFKGVKIVSTEPLVVEYYADLTQPDAENMATSLWPNYGFGEASWDVIALGNLAEAAGELAYSSDKSGAKEVEWTSFVGGPSLEILKKHLDQAETDKYVPYAPTMSQYVTADEAAARYANLQKWYADHGHFIVGTGPYYLDKAFLTEKTLTLKRYEGYPDLAERWSGFGEPMLAEAELDGAGQVKIGEEAAFDVYITYNDQPYPQADIKQVKFLLYNAKNEVVLVGEAQAVADGQYQVILPADVTAKLEAGSNKLEVAVILIPVSVPTFTSIDFVTAP
ncbi:MAG: ABC transporter substrate-binding protein [Anaerolineae bacterium CFX3]|nr:ABC transporter substrate-binding protein [Anaerolineae bacterium]MCE7906398.1 ABC transporter substrate-binding protein [Anaerolineae bacterium CFX3]MCQ3947664.1 ABC transporter substrate-binding protein [Anaerolineae bacterium]RIK27484.1 MAG: ABC transporter substrate-binding protein [Anaerolineae bacterium]